MLLSSPEAGQGISIHAPARGATPENSLQEVEGYFNSRPCERGDKDAAVELLRKVHFNSRPCERGDGEA